MSTFTIRVTSSATNPAGTDLGQQPDLGAPSFWDMVVSNSSDPLIPNGVYDAYCLSPLLNIGFTPASTYTADNFAGNSAAAFPPIGLATLAQTTVDQINWLLSQNFTADPKYAGQFNYGEIQIAIWKLLGFSDAEVAHVFSLLLNDNNRNVVSTTDISFLVSSAQAAVASGINVLPADAFFSTVIDPEGNIQPLIVQLNSAKLGNYVWSDTDADGMQDGNEAGIDNVIVELYDGNGVLIASTVTGDDFSTAAVEQGYYQFAGLKAGDYQVKFIAPTGQLFTAQDASGNAFDASDSDADTATGFSNVITLATGESNQTIDAGLISLVEQNASLGDYVWVDSNNDGQQNDGAAQGLNGVTVNLLNAAGSVIATRITGNDVNGNPGYYLFSDLTPGDYRVEFIKPDGYAFAKQDQGADDSDSDVDTTGRTIATTLSSGENDLSWDAGVVKLASLGDRVWEDRNANGVQDDGETGIGGVTVKLYDCVTKDLIDTTTTDGNGNYHFTGLMPGVYHVEFVAPNGYIYSAQDVTAEDLGTDSDADSAGITACYTVNSGDTIDTVDAGLYRNASLGDYVWEDTDRDGVQDANEHGIAGVTVRLLDCDNGNALVAARVTDADGKYNFADLKPGNYKVEFVTPNGYVLSTRDVGDDAFDSDADAAGLTGCYTLNSGDNNTSVDAGMYRPNVGIDIEKYVRGRYVEETGGGEGLTPGFWKTHSSYGPAPLAGWPETGYGPNDSYESIFGVNVPGTPSLLDALGTGGGGLDALLRHSTAALLNAANPNVDYFYTKAQIVSMTQAAISSGNYDAAKNLFEAQNELGADLDTPAGGGNVIETPDYDADTPTGPLIPVGGQAIFTYVVTNTGEVALSNVNVSDDRIANLTFVGGDADNDGKLDINETWTYTATEAVLPGTQYVNIGTATGLDAATGQSVTDSDAAHYTTSALTASLGDRVWLDANANGVQDAGEIGMAGVTVKLLDGNGVVINTQTTDANGNYLFTQLAPGDYAVQLVAPAGYTITGLDRGGNDVKDSDIDPITGRSINTTLTAGENDLSWDAGLYQKAAIGDRVWLDCDADGIQDVNEVGVAGVVVKLLDAAGNVIASTTTDYQGNYLFSNLTPGDYAVQVVAPNGYGITAKDQGIDDGLDSDIDATTGKTVITTLTSGESDMSWDAGLTTVGVCLDLTFSGNTALDGVDGNIRTYSMNGLSVNASAFSRDKTSGVWSTAWLGSYGGGLGVTDNSEGTGASNTHTVDNTGGKDNYVLFEFNQTVLLDKAYLGYVVGDSDIQVWIGNFNMPYTSHMNLSDAVLASMGFMEVNETTLTTARWADLNASDFAGNTIVIAADSTDTTPEDYFKIETLTVCTPGCNLTASIGDKVWLDANANGVQDTGEVGVAGVAVKLLNAAGTVIATTTTDASGGYLFSNLAAGDYAIQVVAPTGYAFTSKDQGLNDAADSDVDTATGKTVVTTLSGGENDMSWDAGLKLVPTKASIGNKVWHDLDYDGIQDSNEAGIAGVTVKLLNSAGTVLKSMLTNSTGEYLFSNLAPGDYKVQVVKPTGYLYTKADQGANDAIDSDVNSSGITALTNLVAGENDLSWDAGLYKKASIGDKVWEDTNHNWIQDGNDPGIANVKVMLQNSSGVTISTTYTDTYGNYKFINLNPGTYRLAFDKSATVYKGISMTNWMWAKQNVGTNDSVDSDVNGDGISKHNLAYTAYTTLTSGENDMTWDAAITPIVIDLNGDGIHTVARAESGGMFDLLGSGVAINSGWLSGDDGFLAVDSNGNGTIDGIAELFGGLGKGDGFAKLASFDSNGDGVVDADDAGFSSLKVWQDANGNHQTDAGELVGLAEAGVTSLAVAYSEVPFVDANGNLHLERSSATLADGSTVDMTDVYFNVAAEDALAAGVELPTLGQLLGDDAGLDGLLAGLGGGTSMMLSAPVCAETFDTAGLEAMKQIAALYDEQAAACV